MGVEGPAIATVVSQGLSGIICLFYMKKKFPILRISREEWKPKKFYLYRLCYMGIPMGLQYSVTAVGNLVVQAAVNSFGSMVVAGVTAAQRITNFLGCPVEALGGTMAAYTGQNMGAGKFDRIGKGMRDAILCGFAVSVLLLALAPSGGTAAFHAVSGSAG